MRNLRLLFCLSLLVPTLTLTTSASAQHRIALVIANANYPDAGTPLPHAAKDATAVAEEFRRIKFTVDLKENLRKEEMHQTIDAFTAKIKDGTTALFYFSGFGLQVGRKTYLIPVDAQIWSEADVRRDGVSADALLAAMQHEGANVKIVILDAARRNPFERRFRSVAAGLAPLDSPVGTLALYSAAPGRLIRDRSSSGNSLFVAALMKQLHATNLTAEETFNRVRVEVSRASRGEQVPWVASSLLGEIYLGDRPAGPQASSARKTVLAPTDADAKFPNTKSQQGAFYETAARPGTLPPPPTAQQQALNSAESDKPSQVTVTIKLDEKADKRGILGVSIAGLSDELAKTFGLESAHGAIITNVVPDSPAARAGIVPTDVMVEFDGRNIASADELVPIIGATPPGSSARAILWRVAGNAKELAARLQRRAERGDDGAAYGLAWLYLSDNGLLKDDLMAARWARQAADHGRASAIYLLGFLYSKGHGVAKDEAEALNLFRKAAEKNDTRAMFALGRMYQHGEGVGKDMAEARHWYQRAALAGHAPAMVVLGELYAHGDGVAKDNAIAVDWYRKAAQKNNATGFASVGWMYENGRGVPQDYAQAVRWYQKAAASNQAGAIYRLGVMAEAGHGMAKDGAEAVRLFQKAVNFGHPSAMVALGLMYENGEGVKRDPDAALQLFREASEKGNSAGTFYVGLSYERTKDFEKAASSYAEAARKGNIAAMHNLGVCYDRGRGVEENRRLAAEWIFKAIKAGSEFSVMQMTDNPNAYSADLRRYLQRMLKEADVYDGPINGRATSDFKAAVEKLARRSKGG